MLANSKAILTCQIGKKNVSATPAWTKYPLTGDWGRVVNRNLQQKLQTAASRTRNY